MATTCPMCETKKCRRLLKLEEVERRYILAVMKIHGRRRAESAKVLGIGLRTLGIRLNQWKKVRQIPQWF